MFRPCVTVRERSGGMFPPRGEAFSVPGPARRAPAEQAQQRSFMILKTFPLHARRSLQDHGRSGGEWSALDLWATEGYGSVA
jgi:hypothetical protein